MRFCTEHLNYQQSFLTHHYPCEDAFDSDAEWSGIVRGPPMMVKEYNKKAPVVTGNAMIDLLLLALWNNLAQLYSELSKDKGSEELFRHVVQCTLAIHSGIQRYSTSGRQVMTLMETQSQQFLLNATFFRTVYHSTAPAA